MPNHPAILATSRGRPLAQAVCRLLGQEPVPVKIEKRERRDVEVLIEKGVRNASIFIIAPCLEPMDIMEAVHVSDAARRANAASVSLIVPYFNCGRELPRYDRHTSNAVLINVKFLEEAHAKQVVFIDLHTDGPKVAMRKGIPDEFHVSSLVLPSLKLAIGDDDFIVATPVEQAYKRARKCAQLLGKKDALQFSLTEDKKLALPPYIPHDVFGGKTVLLVDSIIDTGKTICRAAALAKDVGATRIIGTAPHGVFSEGAFARIDKCAALESVFVTDTLPNEFDGKLEPSKVKVITVAPLVQEIVRGIRYGNPLSRFA